jgi:hypothetical protein
MRRIAYEILRVTVYTIGARALIINIENLVKILEKTIINHCKPLRNRVNL